MKIVRYISSFFLLVCAFNPLCAQIVEKWVQRYNGPANMGDSAVAVALDDAQNVVVTGISRNANGNDDYLTIKYAADSGEPMWEKRYDNGGVDQPLAMVVDGEGNVIVTGHSHAALKSDIYTVKYAAATGALVWQRRVNGSANSFDYGYAVAVDAVGNVAVAGSAGTIGSDVQMYAAKYAAATGAVIWERYFDDLAIAYSVAVDAAGNVAITGEDYAGSSWNMETVKFAGANGATMWYRVYDGPSGRDDEGACVVMDAAGNVYVTGESEGDIYTVKYAASNGVTLWEKRYYERVGLSGIDTSFQVVLDGAGNVVVGGYSRNLSGNDDFYTAKYSGLDGALVWEKRFNGPANGFDRAISVAVDEAGNVGITGTSSNGANQDFYTAKYAAADGTLIWESRYNGLANGAESMELNLTHACKLVFTSNGGAVMTGTSPNSTNADFTTILYGPADAVGPTNGTLTLDRTLVRPVDGIVATFAGWTDVSLPLSYQIKLDGVLLGAPVADGAISFIPAIADGLHVVTGVISDAVGNVTEVTQNITVDGTPPVLADQDEIQAVATDPAGVVVNFTSTATDNLDPAPVIVQTPPSGSVFPVGTTTVTVVATDWVGNTTQDTFPVTVQRGFVTTTVIAQAGIVNRQLVGTELSDAPGFRLTKLGVPSVSNLHRVIATGTARDGTGKTIAGVLLGAKVNVDIAHTFRMTLRVGGAVPESAGLGAGLKWKAFPREPFMDYTDDAVVAPPAIGNTGTHEVGHWMGFYGRVTGPGVSGANDDVLGFYSLPEVDDEVLVVFAREGGNAPGVTGGKFKTFLSAAAARMLMDDGGGGTVEQRAIAFTAMLKTGPGGVNSATDMGLWIVSDDGTGPHLVLREGQQIGTRKIRSFVALRTPVGHGHGFTRDDDPDHYGAAAGQFSTTALLTFTDGAKQLVAVSREGVKSLATSGTQEPWAGTGLALPWATFPSWFRDGDGHIGVLAGFSDRTAGIFAEDLNGDLQRRVATGDVNGDGSVFTAFKAPVLNGDGALAFAASLKLGTKTVQRGYYHSTAGLLPFLEQGAPAVGADGALWKSLVSHALPDGMGPLFTAKLGSGSAASSRVSAATDLGLWAVDSFGETRLLIREGQSLAGKTVRTFQVLTDVAGSSAQTHSFNGHRDVLVQVFATDGSQHLVHFAVP